jgi:GMP synthase (glutamine-hydrolysing)
MPPRVLIVNNAVHRLVFKPAWHWRSRLKGTATHVVSLRAGGLRPPLSDFTHVILTGSEASILDPQPWFDIEAALIREAVERGLPILGSCFGHEMLVYALSGREYLHPSSPPEIGWTEVQMTAPDPLFEGLPTPWSTFVYHFVEVVDPPAPWRILGRTARCETHVIRYGDRPVWGIQAHPEIVPGKARIFLLATLLLGLKSPRVLLPMLRSPPPRSDIADALVKRFLLQEIQRL